MGKDNNKAVPGVEAAGPAAKGRVLQEGHILGIDYQESPDYAASLAGSYPQHKKPQELPHQPKTEFSAPETKPVPAPAAAPAPTPTPAKREYRYAGNGVYALVSGPGAPQGGPGFPGPGGYPTPETEEAARGRSLLGRPGAFIGSSMPAGAGPGLLPGPMDVGPTGLPLASYCQAWMIHGLCPFGEACMFVHIPRDGWEGPKAPTAWDLHLLANKAPEEVIDARTIRIENVTVEATEEQVRGLFMCFGVIIRVVLPRKDNRRPRGVAYVEFGAEYSASQALSINCIDFIDRPIYISRLIDKMLPPLPPLEPLQDPRRLHPRDREREWERERERERQRMKDRERDVEEDDRRFKKKRATDRAEFAKQLLEREELEAKAREPPKAHLFTEISAKKVKDGLLDESSYFDMVQILAEWIERGFCNNRSFETFYGLLETTFAKLSSVKQAREERQFRIDQLRRAFAKWEDEMRGERAEKETAIEGKIKHENALRFTEDGEMRELKKALVRFTKTGVVTSRKEKRTLKDWFRKVDKILGIRRAGGGDDGEGSDAGSSDHENFDLGMENFDQDIMETVNMQEDDIVNISDIPLPPPLYMAHQPPTDLPPPRYNNSDDMEDMDVEKVPEQAPDDLSSDVTQLPDRIVIDDNPTLDSNPLAFAAASIFLSTRPKHGATASEIRTFIENSAEDLGGANAPASDGEIIEMLATHPHIFSKNPPDAVDLNAAKWKVLTVQ